MIWKPLLFGISTFVPGFNRYQSSGTGGSDNARYCYSVWFRHLAIARANGLKSHPRLVAELGPGDSFGIGLAALLSGAEKYWALDVVEFSSLKRNIQIFDDLVSLFARRARIPGDDEFPDVKPPLESHSLPEDVVVELKNTLNGDRLDEIRASILDPERDGTMISYHVPWTETSCIQPDVLDMVFSQAALEHVDELLNAYENMYIWLKHGGYISHQIDLKCHGTATEWNGHWGYSDLIWKLIRGKRSFLINRVTHSSHKEMRRFSQISDEDFSTSGTFFLAMKE